MSKVMTFLTAVIIDSFIALYFSTNNGAITTYIIVSMQITLTKAVADTSNI